MGDVQRFVVDTCVVVAVLENEDASHPPHEVDAARALLAMAGRGKVMLQRAPAFDRDWERIADLTKRAARLAWLAASPIAGLVAAGVFRFDVSVLGGPDVLGGDEHTKLDQELLRVLGDTRSKKGEAKRSSDRDHLIAAVRSGTDGLVTVDNDTLLVHRPRLAALGVTVVWPSEALALAVGDPLAERR
jgi:hypothetical protein